MGEVQCKSTLPACAHTTCSGPTRDSSPHLLYEGCSLTLRQSGFRLDLSASQHVAGDFSKECSGFPPTCAFGSKASDEFGARSGFEEGQTPGWGVGFRV